jgi:putative ABC transport system permease protein
MALIPISYNARSLLVRRSTTLLTVLGIGATVAVLAGVLALQQGFVKLFAEQGRDDVLVFLRPGATNEGDSIFSLERARTLRNGLSEAERGEDGRYLVSGELYLAVRRFKRDGGETNVPVRGVEQETFPILGQSLRLVEGRRFAVGSDEVIVGQRLVDRIRDCRLGDTVWFNVTPFRVVGVFDYEGPANSEIWGDRDRLAEALERPIYNRLIARVQPGTDLEELKRRYAEDAQVPCKVLTEREYLTSQTQAMSFVLRALGFALATIMGVGAVFTAANTMLAALAARTHEIGILLAIGFRPFQVFLSFLFESLLLGLAGGAVGCLMALPLDRVDTGAMNFQTFTEVAFAFRITGEVLATAVLFALLLGLAGGAWPAWRAARLRPTEALRRE